MLVWFGIDRADTLMRRQHRFDVPVQVEGGKVLLYRLSFILNRIHEEGPAKLHEISEPLRARPQ